MSPPFPAILNNREVIALNRDRDVRKNPRRAHMWTPRTHRDLSPDSAEYSALVLPFGVIMLRTSGLMYRAFRTP